MRRGDLEELERGLVEAVLRLEVVVVQHAVGRDRPGVREREGMRIVAGAVAEEPEAPDVRDVDVELRAAAVVQRR